MATVVLTINQLRAVMPTLAQERAESYLPALVGACAEFQINTPRRQAAFLAQLAHESVQLARFEECLNYSAERLRAVFPKHFSSLDIARRYERQPEKIANWVYRNRMGNGDALSGDGWKFRGRGPMQLTGRENFFRCGQALSLDLTIFPDVVATPDVGFRAAAWFWATRKPSLNALADVWGFLAITRAINGGLNGLADRQSYYKRAKVALGLTKLTD